MNEVQTSTRVADVVAQTLYAHGVRNAFGIPGGEVVTLVDALEKAGISFHLARHETSAAIMAAGASTMRQSPELLVTTVGPGLANAVNGIADALQERVPLIVISGVVDRAIRARYTHQVIDHAQLLRPIVKASFEVEPESAASAIVRAINIATAEPIGPVHLDLSPSIAVQESPTEAITSPTRAVRPSVATRDPAISGMIERLQGAERPLIIAGMEAVRDVAGYALLKTAELLGAPVITTYKAKGIIDEVHPLALGGAGLSPLADRILAEMTRHADVILLAGYDPIEMRPGWMDFAPHGSSIVEISGVLSDHGMHHADIKIHSSPRVLFEALASVLEPRETWIGGEPASAKEKLASVFASRPGWGPHSIVEELNRSAGANAVVTVDSGAHRILLSQKWVSRLPRSLLQSAGFCTMNAALPLSIGVKVSNPTRRVIAVVGDGGLEMGIGELATLRDSNLPITVVVFQDLSLALIELKQASAGLPPLGVKLGKTDFATVAQGFGGHGVNVETLNDLRKELDASYQRQSFTLIACRFDASAYIDAF